MNGLAGILVNLFTGAIIALSAQHPASYQIEARLDTSENKITGSERLEFMNPTSDTLEQICFHLYPNAFKDTSSIFCRENSSVRSIVASGNTSELDVSDLHIDAQAVDSNSIELRGTLLYVKLPSRLPPGKAISISLKFELKIPRAIMRFGYSDAGNYLLAHWYPILCGYQNNKLQDFEYHANSEFYSNFSQYDVELDIPSEFAIGSTGNLTRISADSTRTVWRAVADTVIDFAFACGPAFEVTEADTLGIHIRFLLERRHEKYLRSVEDITVYSLAYNSDKFYKYPYETFTLVDFPSGAQGMELPGMIVIAIPGAGSFSIGEKLAGMAIVHEITHEWFYATVATNEAVEPWLDEGVTSYITGRILSSGGDSLSEIEVLGFKFNIPILERMSALMLKGEYPIDLKSWDYPDDASYAVAVYYRSALIFQTLEEMMGQSKMDSVLGAYALEYRFGSPDGADLKRVLQQNSDIDLAHFQDQFISGTARIDYSVKSISYKYARSEDTTKKYEVNVTVERLRDGIVPETLSLALNDGTRIDTLWNGQERTVTFGFQTSSIPRYAALNPVYALDENIANNTLYHKSLGSRLLTFEWDMIFLKEFILSLLL